MLKNLVRFLQAALLGGARLFRPTGIKGKNSQRHGDHGEGRIPVLLHKEKGKADGAQRECEKQQQPSRFCHCFLLFQRGDSSTPTVQPQDDGTSGVESGL